jgi:hypothetical protein
LSKPLNGIAPGTKFPSKRRGFSRKPAEINERESRPDWAGRRSWRTAMTLDVVSITPLVALICGILILVVPRLLNFIVAIYLIIVGVTGLWPHLLR